MIYLQLIIQIPIFENNFKNTLITDKTLMKRLILISTFACLMFSELFAAIEIPSTQGSEFYLSFPSARFDRTKNMSLTVSSNAPGILVIADAQGNITSKPFIAGSTKLALVNSNLNDVIETVLLTGLTSCYTIKSNSVENRGYILSAFHEDGVTPQKVSIYAALDAAASIDAANIYPIEALGNEYYVISHAGFSQSSTPYKSEALVMATEDNTIIEIKPTVLLDNQTPTDNIKDIFIILNKGQTYQIRALDLGDLTGTVIRTKNNGNLNGNSCKRIAVFSGIQHGYPGDYEYDQLFPTHLQGNEYLVAPPEQGGEVVRIVASSPCTEININGQLVATLNQTEHYDFIDQNITGCHIQTSKPVGVAMFTTDFITPYRNSSYEASMAVLAPINQKLDSIAFTTPATGYTNKLNIVCSTENKDNVLVYQLNNGVWSLVALSTWNDFAATSDFKFMNLTISEGYTYKIVSTAGGFNAYVYGYDGSAEYSYSLGASAAMAKTSFSINGIPSSNLSPSVCVDKAIDLEPTFPAGMTISKVEWDYESDGIVDETSYEATNFKLSHAYPTSGVYKIKMIVHKASVADVSCWGVSSASATDTVSAELGIKLYIYQTTKDISLCKGDKLISTLPTPLLPPVVAKTVWFTKNPNGKDSLIFAYNDKLTLDIPLDYGKNRKYWRRSFATNNNCDIYIDTFNVSIKAIKGNEYTLQPFYSKGDILTSTRTATSEPDFNGRIVSYAWLDSGFNPVNGATSQSYTLNDDYGVNKKYIVESKAGCLFRDTFNVSMNTETGIENSKTQSNTISIYPNPADDVLNVSLSKNADKIEIKDMLGNTLISEAVTEKNIPIDIKQLASGLYILNIIDNRKSQSIRFIKK